jgi:L-arabinose isomerase
VFDATPGEGVLLGLVDMGHQFRFVANEAEVVAPLAPLPHLPVARAVWRPAPDLQTSTEAWLTAGGPHHTVLSTALTAEHLLDLTEMLGAEMVLIDERTRSDQMRYELRQGTSGRQLADRPHIHS